MAEDQSERPDFELPPRASIWGNEKKVTVNSPAVKVFSLSTGTKVAVLTNAAVMTTEAQVEDEGSRKNAEGLYALDMQAVKKLREEGRIRDAAEAHDRATRMATFSIRTTPVYSETFLGPLAEEGTSLFYKGDRLTEYEEDIFRRFHLPKDVPEFSAYQNKNQGLTIVYDPDRKIYLVEVGQDINAYDVAVACSLLSVDKAIQHSGNTDIKPSHILKVARMVADSQELKGCFTTEGKFLKRKTTFDKPRFLEALPDIVSLCSVQLRNVKQELYV